MRGESTKAAMRYAAEHGHYARTCNIAREALRQDTSEAYSRAAHEIAHNSLGSEYGVVVDAARDALRNDR
jgi:hypothetical protein